MPIGYRFGRYLATYADGKTEIIYGKDYVDAIINAQMLRHGVEASISRRAHHAITHGFCDVCGHYGMDCTARKYQNAKLRKLESSQ